MKLSAILAPLIAAKVPHEIIMQTVQAWETEQSDALEKRRAADRERQARQRDRNVTSRDVTVTVSSRVGVARGLDNLQSRDQAGQKDQISFDQEFENDIWPAYPRKVAKGHARKTYIAIRKRGVPFESILSGVKRYAKERASEDPAFTKHASTWLNSEGWLDEPAALRPRGTSPPQQTIGDVFRQDARDLGIIPNADDAGNSERSMDTSHRGRQGDGSGGARILALPKNILGGFG